MRTGTDSRCAFETSFVRQGLKVGLELERELGLTRCKTALSPPQTRIIPIREMLKNGIFLVLPALSLFAFRRLRPDGPLQPLHESMIRFHTSGGLAAVWAPENTREAIFDALARRETYGTSGPRIAARFYAGWQIDEPLLQDPNELASQIKAVPMGGVLHRSQRRARSNFLSGQCAITWMRFAAYSND